MRKIILLLLSAAALFTGCSGEQRPIVATAGEGMRIVAFDAGDSDTGSFVAGPGCWYYSPDSTEGSDILFESSISMEDDAPEQALMMINGRREILRIDTTVQNFSESAFRAGFENAGYRVDLDMVVDSPSDGGEFQHGEIMVIHKGSREKVILPVRGGCGC